MSIILKRITKKHWHHQHNKATGSSPLVPAQIQAWKLHMKKYYAGILDYNYIPWFLSFNFFFFSMAQQPLVGQCLLIIEASRSHSDTLHTAGQLWTSDQPDAKTSTWQHITLTRDRHPCNRGDSNPRPQTHALDRVATGIGLSFNYGEKLKDLFR
jgi:hypothetical protein